MLKKKEEKKGQHKQCQNLEHGCSCPGNKLAWYKDNENNAKVGKN